MRRRERRGRRRRWIEIKWERAKSRLGREKRERGVHACFFTAAAITGSSPESRNPVHRKRLEKQIARFIILYQKLGTRRATRESYIIKKGRTKQRANVIICYQKSGHKKQSTKVIIFYQTVLVRTALSTTTTNNNSTSNNNTLRQQNRHGR